MRLHPLLLGLLLLCFGCSDERTADTAGGDTTADVDSARPPGDAGGDARPGDGATTGGAEGVAGRPATRADTVKLEGSEYINQVTLFEAERFTTYYPKDSFIAEQSSSGEGNGVRFIANFSGVRNDSAFLHIFTPNDPGAGAEEAKRLLLEENGIVRSNGWTATKAPRASCPEATETYSIAGPRGSQTVGFACVGEHAGRGYVIVAVYPAEYGDGMGPRVERIIHHIEWKR